MSHSSTIWCNHPHGREVVIYFTVNLVYVAPFLYLIPITIDRSASQLHYLTPLFFVFLNRHYFECGINLTCLFWVLNGKSPWGTLEHSKSPLWNSLLYYCLPHIKFFYPNEFKSGNFEFSSVSGYLSSPEAALLKCQRSNYIQWPA